MVVMLSGLSGFVIGLVFGIVLALSYPHQLHTGLAKIGLGSIGTGAMELKN